jgi:acyl-CoA synthetase (AMP-forming)/AMP-acid ligase II
MTDEQLTGFLADRLAKFKIPSSIWFRSQELPRNANGKFVKRALRDELVGG